MSASSSLDPSPAVFDASAWAAWRAARLAQLSGPDSWLGVTGLYPLPAGRHTVGSAPDAAVVLPDGPAHLGWFLVETGEPAGEPECLVDALAETRGAASPSAQGTAVRWQAAGAEARLVSTDRDGPAEMLDAAQARFFVIERQGRLFVRVRDRAWASRRPFAGIDTYPFASEWVRAARWERLSTPLTVELPDVSGELRPITVFRQAVFLHEGREIRLLPVSDRQGKVMFVFRDRTSGRESYGAGRFLEVESPEGAASLTLDFNRAFNPPCALTPFATCPLPPAENWLDFPITAGEKKP